MRRLDKEDTARFKSMGRGALGFAMVTLYVSLMYGNGAYGMAPWITIGLLAFSWGSIGIVELFGYKGE